MVEQGPNVMNEEWVKLFSDFLLIREIQRAVERNPDTLKMHGPNFHDMSGLFALQNTVSTTTRHSSDVQELCAVNHVVIFTAGDANPLSFNLKA